MPKICFYIMQNSSKSLPQHRTPGSVEMQGDHRQRGRRHKQILQQTDGHQLGLLLEHNR